MNQKQRLRVKELFIVCCNLDDDAQQAELERQCVEDGMVRAEVERLLDQDAIAASILDEPAFDSTRDADELSAKRSIGGYEILGKIGEGGMGIVYHALQPNPRRIVALKVLRSSLPTAAAKERFQRECSVLARFEHQGIARIFEAGTYESDHGAQPWFAMEFIRGQPLTQHAREKDMSMPGRLDLAVQACRAVQHAHQRGVLHRDLKPANLLVNETGQVKVIDFGIARALDGGEELGEFRTLTEEFVGTPLYMSPEQLLESPEGLDVSSDIYSLGVTLFELLAESPPYDLEEASRTEIHKIVCERAPRRPSTIHAGISKDLEAVLLCALEKEPARRYASVRAFAEDLECVATGRPVIARPPSLTRRATVWLQGNPLAAAGIAVLLIALISAGTLTTNLLVGHWRTAKTMQQAWHDGDIEVIHGVLDSMPSWARSMFLSTDLAELSDPSDDQAETPVAVVKRVIEDLIMNGSASAHLLAARFLERDGLLAHPTLSAFLARSLGANPADPSKPGPALGLVARLFFERPDASPKEVLASAGFRDRLEELSEHKLHHLDRLRIMTALSGCGDPGSVPKMLACLRLPTPGCSISQTTEEVRLTMFAIEVLVRRGHSCKYLEQLYGSGTDDIIKNAIRALNALQNKGRSGESLEALCVTDAIARRSIGAAPSQEPMPVGSRVSRAMVKSARGDAATRKALIADPRAYIGTGSAIYAGHLLSQYAFALECAELYRPGTEASDAAIEIAVGQAVQAGLTDKEARSLVQAGVERARQAKRGNCPERIPDLDTHLGEALAFANLRPDQTWKAAPSRRVETGEPHCLAGWDFTGQRVGLSAGARSVLLRGLRQQADEIQSQVQYARFGLPGISGATLNFSIDKGHAAYVEIDIRKGTRSLLPYLGESFIKVRVDGMSYGVFRVESISPLPTRLSLGRDLVSSGAHEILIELGEQSNTTLRLFSVVVNQR